jgi:antitoxin PrlF
MLTTITSKGQVTVPKNIRDMLHLYAGDKVEFVFNEANEVIIRPVTKKAADVCGGLAKYKQKSPITVEEMNESIEKMVKQKFNEST